MGVFVWIVQWSIAIYCITKVVYMILKLDMAANKPCETCGHGQITILDVVCQCLIVIWLATAGCFNHLFS